MNLVRFYDLASGGIYDEIVVHSACSLAVSPDGRLLLVDGSGGAGSNSSLWHIGGEWVTCRLS